MRLHHSHQLGATRKAQKGREKSYRNHPIVAGSPTRTENLLALISTLCFCTQPLGGLSGREPTNAIEGKQSRAVKLESLIQHHQLCSWQRTSVIMNLENVLLIEQTPIMQLSICSSKVQSFSMKPSHRDCMPQMRTYMASYLQRPLSSKAHQNVVTAVVNVGR